MECPTEAEPSKQDTHWQVGLPIILPCAQSLKVKGHPGRRVDLATQIFYSLILYSVCYPWAGSMGTTWEPVQSVASAF